MAPRQANVSRWGKRSVRSSPALAGRVHHYRRLQEGHKASDAARANARRMHRPEPPAGFTFVAPQSLEHDGGQVTARAEPVVCRGLQVASIIMAIA